MDLTKFNDSSDRISHSGSHCSLPKEAISAGFLLINPSSIEIRGQGKTVKIHPYGYNEIMQIEQNHLFVGLCPYTPVTSAKFQKFLSSLKVSTSQNFI